MFISFQCLFAYMCFQCGWLTDKELQCMSLKKYMEMIESVVCTECTTGRQLDNLGEQTIKIVNDKKEQSILRKLYLIIWFQNWTPCRACRSNSIEIICVRVVSAIWCSWLNLSFDRHSDRYGVFFRLFSSLFRNRNFYVTDLLSLILNFCYLIIIIKLRDRLLRIQFNFDGSVPVCDLYNNNNQCWIFQ